MARYVPKETALSNPLRLRLLDAVGQRPGITLSQIADQFGCQPSTVVWHMTKLEKADLMRTARVGNSRVFYLPSGGQALRDQSLASAVLRNDVARRIHEAVRQQPGITFRGLRLHLMERGSALRWHARRLVAEGLISLGEGRGRATEFYPAGGSGASGPGKAA